MAKLSSFKGKGRYPAPVYVAEMSTGEKLRMSFWSDKSKPINSDNGKRLVEQVTGAAVIAGRVEWNGAEIVATPSTIARPNWRAIADKARAALQRGDVAHALAVLERAA